MGQGGTDEKAQLPGRQQIQHQDCLPTCPGLLLALSWGGCYLEQVLAQPYPLHVSVSNEKFLTLQDALSLAWNVLPASLPEGLSIPQNWFRIFYLRDAPNRLVLAGAELPCPQSIL